MISQKKNKKEKKRKENIQTLAILSPQPAATIADAVETLNVFKESPPVPTRSQTLSTSQTRECERRTSAQHNTTAGSQP